MTLVGLPLDLILVLFGFRVFRLEWLPEPHLVTIHHPFSLFSLCSDSLAHWSSAELLRLELPLPLTSPARGTKNGAETPVFPSKFNTRFFHSSRFRVIEEDSAVRRLEAPLVIAHPARGTINAQLCCEVRFFSVITTTLCPFLAVFFVCDEGVRFSEHGVVSDWSPSVPTIGATF